MKFPGFWVVIAIWLFIVLCRTEPLLAVIFAALTAYKTYKHYNKK